MLLLYRKLALPVYDLGLFNRHMLGLANADFGANPLKGYNLLGEHSHIFLILLAPIYKLFTTPIVLLVVQAFAIGLSGYPIYLLGKKLFNSGTLAGFWLVPYFMFYGFWAAVAYPFHDSPVAVLPLAWALYFLITDGSRKWLVLSLIGLILIREDMALVVLFFGIYLILIKRQYKLGAIIGGLSAMYFVVMTQFVMPAISHVKYQYDKSFLGNSMGEALINVISKPWLAVKEMFLPIPKTWTILFSLLSFGGLALLALEILLLVLPLWAGRFYSVDIMRRSVVQHYGASQAPILAATSILGASRLFVYMKNRVSAKVAIMVVVGLVLVGNVIVYFGVIEKYYLQLVNVNYYRLTSTEQAAWQAISLIPADASIGVQSAFVPLTTRKEVHPIPLDFDEHKPQYLVYAMGLDSWPLKGEELQKNIQKAKEDGYTEFYYQSGVTVLKR